MSIIQVYSIQVYLVLFSCLLTDFIASGFGYHFNAIATALRAFPSPSESCGWDVQKHLPYCYVTVRAPSGGFYSTVSVETPLKTFQNHFKRVSAS